MNRIVTLRASDQDFAGSAGAFRFDLELTLGSTPAGDVSDHYPIWAQFRTERDTD